MSGSASAACPPATTWGTLGAMGCLSWFLLFAIGGCGQAHVITKAIEQIRDLIIYGRRRAKAARVVPPITSSGNFQGHGLTHAAHAAGFKTLARFYLPRVSARSFARRALNPTTVDGECVPPIGRILPPVERHGASSVIAWASMYWSRSVGLNFRVAPIKI